MLNACRVLFWTLLMTSSTTSDALRRQEYAMYVWTNGFDNTLPNCGFDEFLDWNTSGPCFTHVWNTIEKRNWLWNTCNTPGREIAAIFISEVHGPLHQAYTTSDCLSSGVDAVRRMLEEGHSQVPLLKIYGLYAASDLDVSERYMIKHIVYYNEMCARSPNERFDGVAINNLAYSSIKCGNQHSRLKYLGNLNEIVIEAGKQTRTKLLTHYSVIYHWGICADNSSLITWNNKTDDVMHHMVDMFDSIDVQVGYITMSAIAERMLLAGYGYAKQLGKSIYATFNTEKAPLCQTTFFPSNSCIVDGHTEEIMFRRFDAFTASGIEHANPCIHYFRGIYSSGVNDDWPVHGNLEFVTSSTKNMTSPIISPTTTVALPVDSTITTLIAVIGASVGFLIVTAGSVCVYKIFKRRIIPGERFPGREHGKPNIYPRPMHTLSAARKLPVPNDYNHSGSYMEFDAGPTYAEIYDVIQEPSPKTQNANDELKDDKVENVAVNVCNPESDESKDTGTQI